MDEQKALLQGLWRKAFSQDDPVAIPCRTVSNAARLRFAIYNSVRGVRDGKVKVDEALREAVANCSVGYLDGDKTTLVLHKKVLTELMQVVTEIVGTAEGTLKSPEDMEMEASQKLLMEKLAAGGTPAGDTALGLPRSTPYYTR